MKTQDCNENKKHFHKLSAKEKKKFEARFMICWYKFIANSINKFHCSFDVANDAFEEAVLKVYEKIKKNLLPALHCSLSTYIYGTAKHLLIKKLHELQKNLDIDDCPNVAPVVPEPSVEDENTKLRKHYIELMMQSLSKTDSKIIDLFYFKHYHWKTIAKLMHKSSDYLKTRKHEIIVMLKDKFKELEWLLFL